MQLLIDLGYCFEYQREAKHFHNVKRNQALTCRIVKYLVYRELGPVGQKKFCLKLNEPFALLK